MVPVVSPGVGDNRSGGRLDPGSSCTPAPPSIGIVDMTPESVGAGGVVVSLPQPAANAANTMVATTDDRSCRAALGRLLEREFASSESSVIARLYPSEDVGNPRTLVTDSTRGLPDVGYGHGAVPLPLHGA